MISKKNKKAKYKAKINWKKELSLLPGYVIVLAWIFFTAVFLIWILGSQPLYIKGDIFR